MYYGEPVQQQQAEPLHRNETTSVVVGRARDRGGGFLRVPEQARWVSVMGICSSGDPPTALEVSSARVGSAAGPWNTFPSVHCAYTESHPHISLLGYAFFIYIF